MNRDQLDYREKEAIARADLLTSQKHDSGCNQALCLLRPALLEALVGKIDPFKSKSYGLNGIGMRKGARHKV